MTEALFFLRIGLLATLASYLILRYRKPKPESPAEDDTGEEHLHI